MRNGNENGCLSLGMDVINWIVLGSKKTGLVLVKTSNMVHNVTAPDRIGAKMVSTPGSQLCKLDSAGKFLPCTRFATGFLNEDE